jgi:hypothetical protein
LGKAPPRGYGRCTANDLFPPGPPAGAGGPGDSDDHNGPQEAGEPGRPDPGAIVGTRPVTCSSAVRPAFQGRFFLPRLRLPLSWIRVRAFPRRDHMLRTSQLRLARVQVKVGQKTCSGTGPGPRVRPTVLPLAPVGLVGKGGTDLFDGAERGTIVAGLPGEERLRGAGIINVIGIFKVTIFSIATASRVKSTGVENRSKTRNRGVPEHKRRVVGGKGTRRGAAVTSIIRVSQPRNQRSVIGFALLPPIGLV